MEIKSLTLKNIGHFKELTIPFAPPLEEGKPKVTVFIGNNGSGKTNILKSVVTALSWLPARIRNERGRGLDIPEDVISNDETSALVSIDVSVDFNKYQWTLSKTRKGRKNRFTSDLKGVAALADQYRHDLTTQDADTNLPLIVFYPVERSVLDIPLKIRKAHWFDQLEAYDNALDMGVDFRRFFEWFREQEDIENARIAQSELIEMQGEMDGLFDQLDFYEKIMNLSERFNQKQINEEQFAKEIVSLTKDYSFNQKKREFEQQREKLELMTDTWGTNYSDVNLRAVRNSIKEFTGFENIWIKRKPLRMMVKKGGQEFNVFQLSQGEKSLMALVGDIARRLAMLNPSLDNPLHGKGVVIIDEADLHLHPQWQRQLIARLTQTFPNCQFILSTHSPLVISDSKDIMVYALENGEMTKIPSQYGQDANTVYLNAMDTAIRNEQVAVQLNELFNSIHNNKLDEAKEKLAHLEIELSDNNHLELTNNHLELTKAQLLIKKQELRNEINQ